MNLKEDLLSACDATWWCKEALGFCPDEWQARVLMSNSKRQILLCSRQAGKSTTAAALALHQAIYHPGSLTLLVSPSLRQSGELFRKISDFVDRLPEKPRLKEDNRLSLTMQNGSRIVSLPGSESTIRGFSGVSLIVEDEAARVPDDLYYAIRPMLAVSQGRLILMSTPFRKRGHFFKEWTEAGNSWERTEIPASACPRITPGFLLEERLSLGDWWFRQEYGAEFVETDSQLFSYDLVHAALTTEIQPLFPVNPEETGAVTDRVKVLFPGEEP